MSDRELLEAAAKAAGLIVHRSRLDDPMWRDLLLDLRPAFPQTAAWNPLTDDGDAFRLAVKLNLQISYESAPDDSYVQVLFVHCPGPIVSASEDLGRDPCAATRRAIVRAAAALSTPGEAP